MALTAGVIVLGGAGAADAKDSAARTKSYQKQFIDPQAPVGTEAKSSKTASAEAALDSPVETKAVDPTAHLTCSGPAAAAGGRWSELKSLPSGSNAYHLIMGPGGKILLIAGSGNNSAVFEAGTFKAYLWEPGGALEELKNIPHDMFCAGHMLMSNGQGIAAGGTTDYSPWKGSETLYTFDFGSKEFQEARKMVDGRWYPTVVNTRGGYALIVGGFNGTGQLQDV